MATPRVRIAVPRPDDRDAFLAATARSQVLHRPWVAPPHDGPAYASYLARLEREHRAGFLVWRLADDALVGVVNLNDVARGALQSTALGYYGFAPHTGQGLVAEGVALAVDYAFGALALHRVEANVQPRNEASLALVRRLGFRHEGFSPRFLEIGGQWRDHERFAVLADEWRSPFASA